MLTKGTRVALKDFEQHRGTVILVTTTEASVQWDTGVTTISPKSELVQWISAEVVERINVDEAAIRQILDTLRDHGIDADVGGAINNDEESGVFGTMRTNSGASIRFTLTRDVY